MKNNSKNIIPILSMFLIFFIDLVIILSTHNNWNDSMQKYLPLKSVIQTVRNDITTAHLWLEESISGDKYVDLDTDVFNKLKVVEYKDYIEKSEASLREKEDKYFYKELMLIDKKIDTLYILAEKRLQDIKEHKIGSNLDQIFDKEFKEITSLLLSLNNSIDDKLLKKLIKKKIILFWY